MGLHKYSGLEISAASRQARLTLFSEQLRNSSKMTGCLAKKKHNCQFLSNRGRIRKKTKTTTKTTRTDGGSGVGGGMYWQTGAPTFHL